MKNLNQLIIKFDYEQNFKMMIFMFQKIMNIHLILFNSWPKWEKNF